MGIPCYRILRYYKSVNGEVYDNQYYVLITDEKSYKTDKQSPRLYYLAFGPADDR